MNAEINQNGQMTISPESELEAYALKAWAKESCIMNDSNSATSFANILVIGNYESPHNASPIHETL